MRTKPEALYLLSKLCNTESKCQLPYYLIIYILICVKFTMCSSIFPNNYVTYLYILYQTVYIMNSETH